MNPLHPITSCCLVLALGLALAPTSAAQSAQEGQSTAQDAPVQANQTQVSDLPLISTEDLTTSFFTPKYTSVHELVRVADQIHGRFLHLVEHGGYTSPPIRNLQLLGDSLLICDDRENARRILDWLKLLDRPVDDSRDTTPIETSTWTPRHISLGGGLAALQSFQHPVQIVSGTGQQRQTTSVQNISLVKERNTLVLRDTPAQLAVMREMLESIDRPEPQLLLTAMVLLGTHDNVSTEWPLSPELTHHLSQLLPFEHYTMKSMGVVRSSALSQGIDLSMDNGNRLVLDPETYDPQTGSLNTELEFSSRGGFQFETSTSLQAGEWTVLGVSGGQAMFVVLRMEPQAH